MILCDVNVLIYAFRDDAQDHVQYKAWLESRLAGAAPVGVSPQVLAAVVRVCTHPKIFNRPDSTATVMEYCRAVLSAPNITIVLPGERHWSIFEDQCRRAGATGNLVQDAWFAALAIESGCRWITTDRDYARFPDLEWATPF